ncbi:MAG: PAS domain S-box protein [Bacteroidales bacterium]|nr:PAS domain S-box protein [Bacteroidales bacterium]
MILIDLIYNLSVLVAISALSGFINQRFDRNLLSGKVLQGLLFGSATMVGMMYPFVVTEGIIFDGRSIVISLAALFFGPVSGAISAIIAVSYRLYLGGSGILMGSLVILSSFAIGWASHSYRRWKKIVQIKVWGFLLMGILVHVVMIVLMLALPSAVRRETFQLIGFTVLGIYPLVTVIIGKVLLDQELNSSLFKQLSESEKLYRTTFYSIGDGVITTDINGNINQLNPVAEKLTGFNENEIVGKNIKSVIRFVDEISMLEIENPLQLVLEQKEKVSFDSFLLIDAHGNKIPVADSAAPIFDNDSKMIGAVMVFRDRANELERQKQAVRSAKSYRSLFNSIKGAAYVQDAQGRFLDVNDGALALYGYPREKFIGNTPEFLSAPGYNDLEELKKNIAAAFNGKAVQFEFWGIRSNGEIFPKEVSLFKTIYFDQEAIIAIAQDITERKNAENALRISEERYRSLFESSPVGIILEDLEGTILDVNQTLCNDFGYEAKDLIGKNIEIIVPEKFRPQVKQNIEAIVQKKVLYSRVESLAQNNKIKISELIETLVTLPDGRQGVLSISKNITEQVLAERTLIKSESRNRAIISAIPDIFFRIDKDGRFIDCVAQDQSLLLVSSEELLGRTCFDVLPPSLAKLTSEKIAITLDKGELLQYEYSLYHKEKQRWYEARMVKSGDEEVLVIVRDITNKKEADIEIQQQSKFIETLLESIPNPLFYMDRKGAYLGVNKAFADLFGFKKEDIIGRSLHDIDDYEIAQRNIASDQRIFDGKDKIQTLERELKLPSGETKSVILTKSPFPDTNGNIGGLIGMIVDISARKKMELDLTHARNKAQESDRLKTSFLNNLNHEIRTPLNAIVGFSDLLFDDYPEAEKHNFVEIINNNAEQLLRIIDDVLAVSRLDSEKIPLENKDFSLNQLFHDLFQTFYQKAAEKNIALLLDTDQAKNVNEMHGDKGKIRQILSGLINNAIKYTLEGHIKIGYSIQVATIRFYVLDTGIGIPPDEQPHVFERFFRGNESQLRAIRGNGLGLSIAQGLAGLMDGTIELESESNKGSTFSLIIPYESSHSSNTEAKPIKKIVSLEKLRVLVAEDENDNFEYILTLLNGKVKEIVQAKTGLDAVRMNKENPFDLILMDIKMPEMDGFEATRIILKDFPKIPVIAQTAYSQPIEIQKAMDAGCINCLIKPIEKEKLYSALNELFD